MQEKAYAEVNQILTILGTKYQEKIPPKVRKLFEQEQAENNIIKPVTNLEDLQLSRKALIISSILNLKYWASKEEKKKLKKLYNKNEIEYQQKINSYQKEDWLKKKQSPKVQVEERSLVREANIGGITKIRRFFRNLWHKNGR